MKSVLREVSLLLEQFQQSEWRDMHMRTEHYSLFIAKPNGGRNPMLGAPPQMPVGRAAASAQSTTVVAPHLATLRCIVAVGSDVRVGSVIAQLEVLEVLEDVVSRAAGVVGEVMLSAGALVEYETPLLRID